MKNKALLIASLALISSNALAAGYSTNSTSSSALATSYAGSVTGAHDISNMYINPAILSKFDKKQFIASVSYLDVDIDPENETMDGAPNSASGEVGDAGINPIIPSFYFSSPITEKTTIGFLVNSPFGLATEYNSDWTGVELTNDTEIKTINLGVNLSQKLTDELSLGFGVNAQKMQFTKSLIPQGSTVKYKGSDWGYGYSLGLNYDLTEKLDLGLSYNSKVKHELNGTFQVPASNIYDDGVLKISTPESAIIGARYDLNDKLNLMSDIVWTRWSRQKEFELKESGTNKTLSLLTYNWHDTFMYSLGGDYQYNDELLVRFGTAFQTNAPDNQYRTADVPTGDAYWLSTGINYDFGNDLSLDASYVHQFYENVKVNNKGLSVKYRTQVNIFSFGLKKTF
jgi:long-chain fatty acid transport protein